MDSGYSTNCNSTSNLNEDVLSEVYGHLDFEELVQCEAVCRQWREILLNGPIWKRWFQKQVALSPSWREIWKKMAIDKNALEPAYYRAICRESYRQAKELNNNWCTGQYVPRNTLLHLPPSRFAYRSYFYDDWIVVASSGYDHHSREIMTYLYFFMKNSSHVTECITLPPNHDFRYTDENFLICSRRSNVYIFDRRIDKFTVQINEDEGRYIQCATLYNGLLGVLSQQRYNGRFLLSVWNVENPSRIALLKQFSFDVDYCLNWTAFDVSITIDEQFIVVKGYIYEEREGKRPCKGIWPKCRKEPLKKAPVVVAHFISTRTLEVERLLTVDALTAVYDKGLLFVLIHGRVRIYDVSSGTFYRDLLLQKNASNSVCSSQFLVSVNSKYVAILYKAYWRWFGWKTKLWVYELAALKNFDAEPKSLLLTTIENDGPLSMTMDETRIVICTVLYNELDKSVGPLFLFVFDFSPRQTEQCSKIFPSL